MHIYSISQTFKLLLARKIGRLFNSINRHYRWRLCILEFIFILANMRNHSILTRLISLVLVGLFFISCGSSGNSASDKTSLTDTIKPAISNIDRSIPGSFSTQTKIKFDSSQVKIFLDSFSIFKIFENDIYSFYRRRNFAYAWFDEKGMIEPANNVYNRIQNISEQGVPDRLPYKEAFTNLIESIGTENKAYATLELMLTSQYLVYANTVWKGLNEKQMQGVEWLLPRKKISNRQLLDSLSGTTFLENEPVYKQYPLLKAYLKKYNDLKQNNILPKIKSDKKKLQPGDSSNTIGSVREWLFIMGDIAENNQSNLFDIPLSDGIKTFQIRTGIAENGQITPAVIAEMNYPLEKRIETIIVNMERCRWVPATVQKNYLFVNIPAYKLYVVENDSLAFNMNVVVGKSQHKTAVFNGDVKYVVFSPYWNIPASIMKNETLPAIRRNSRYLAQHNMEWNGNQIRQKPGPNNSLGLVKFLFPNSHSIYLHDTPAKSLFNETNRAFSHGCIRLAEPKKLASYLLRNDSTWNDATITAAMESGIEKTVILKKTTPVFIAYFTSWVDKYGKINFRNDVYSRDSRLAELIMKNP